jgi:hypothetical protein
VSPVSQISTIALLTALTIAMLAYAGRQSAISERTPLIIELVNQAGDIPGVWDAKIRVRATEALTRNPNDVSRFWLGGRPVQVEIGTPAPFRLIAVNRRLDYEGTPASGYHEHDEKGPYGIVNIVSAGSNVDLNTYRRGQIDRQRRSLEQPSVISDHLERRKFQCHYFTRSAVISRS